MSGEELRAWLMRGATGGVCDAFDAHCVASMIAIALDESRHGGTPLPEAIGLSTQDLRALVRALFPGAASPFESLEELPAPSLPEDEACLRDLLLRSATGRTALEACLAAMVARRAQRPNHLWQDLGLRHRRELSWMMERHFEVLASRNARDMKWKKFLYRTLCRDASYTLCTAPSCSECDDFENCYGDESGESLLAKARLRTDRGECRESDISSFVVGTVAG